MKEANGRIIMGFDEYEYNILRDQYNSVGEQLQNVIIDYNVLGLPPLTSDEFVKLIEKPQDLVFDKMTNGEPVSIAGLKVDKTKAIEILQKPVGYQMLIDRVESIQRNGLFDRQTSNKLVQYKAVKEWFELKEGNVIIKESADKVLKERFQSFAETDNAKNMLAFATGILALSDSCGVTELLNANPDGIWMVVKHIIKGGEGKPFQIDIKMISRYNDPLFRKH